MECKKFWSYVIDFYIYYAILFIGSSIVKNLIMYNGTINLFRMPLLIVWFILILINDLMLGNRSIGKHMMEIEVVDKDGNIVDSIEGSNDYDGWKAKIDEVLEKVMTNE